MSPVTTCPCFSSAYQCCSQVRTSLPDRSCFHCSRKCNAQRTHPWADKTCCTRSRSSARHSWPGSGTQIVPRVRYASASASAGWGWSCQNERLSLLTSHLHLKCTFWHHETIDRKNYFQKIESSVQMFKPGREKWKAVSYLHYVFRDYNVPAHIVGTQKWLENWDANCRRSLR